MTPDEERRVLQMLESHDRVIKMLESHEWAIRFWIKSGIWAKWLATVSAGVAGLKYLLDIGRGIIK